MDSIGGRSRVCTPPGRSRGSALRCIETKVYAGESYTKHNNAGRLVARLAVALGTRERGASHLGSVFTLNSQFERLRAKRISPRKRRRQGRSFFINCFRSVEGHLITSIDSARKVIRPPPPPRLIINSLTLSRPSVRNPGEPYFSTSKHPREIPEPVMRRLWNVERRTLKRYRLVSVMA